MTCMTCRREGSASPPPSSSVSSYQNSAAFLLRLFHSGISINRASSALLTELLLTSFVQTPLFHRKTDHDTFRLLCSATGACLPSCFWKYFVFHSTLVFPDLCLDIFFPIRLSLSTVPPIWPSWQHITLLLFLAKILRKSFGHFSLLACWATC